MGEIGGGGWASCRSRDAYTTRRGSEEMKQEEIYTLSDRSRILKRDKLTKPSVSNSQTTHRPPQPSQRRTILHRHARAHAPQYRREHKRTGEMVEYFPAGSFNRGGHLSGLVAEEIFRGMCYSVSVLSPNDRRGRTLYEGSTIVRTRGGI